ncbi:hypothetical protein ACFQI7_28130 [Paenibacillus allorhizosphaerae]|uniref:Uncharacterized protein n=1 Tax=Paenibacillus allorhizosphaerae TaxID=2849866 RepID=A0ABM8VNH4_9BACL|nr:hypothetical protein [Paenibacillus allorhizosphaerae]CAG7651518.1 hypothetical protein PAECIP111802_04984 [Paenibacillus allorhizosphaerae]
MSTAIPNSKSNKEEVYLAILMSVGPYPSRGELIKAFDLMAYSADERSEILVLFGKALAIFNDKTKGYIKMYDLLFNLKSFSLFVVIIAVLLFLSNIFQFNILYSLLTCLVVCTGISIKYPWIRPIREKPIWNSSVRMAIEEVEAQNKK